MDFGLHIGRPYIIYTYVSMSSMSNVYRVQLYGGCSVLGAMGFHERPHIPSLYTVLTQKNVDIEDIGSYDAEIITRWVGQVTHSMSSMSYNRCKQ